MRGVCGGWDEAFEKYKEVKLSSCRFRETSLKNGEELSGIVHIVDEEVDSNLRSEILQLLQKSFKSQGWDFDEKEKASDLFENSRTMNFLLYKDTQEDVEAMAAMIYDFDWLTIDEETSVNRLTCYLYEIHVAETLRGKGIGTKIMKILESDCRANDINFITLTVMQDARALNFYEKLGFDIDTTSPSVHGQDETYEILSKQLS